MKIISILLTKTKKYFNSYIYFTVQRMCGIIRKSQIKRFSIQPDDSITPDHIISRVVKGTVYYVL